MRKNSIIAHESFIKLNLVPRYFGIDVVNAEDLRDTLKKQPFQPFRIVLTDGASYEIRHPDFLFISKRTAVVGVPGPVQSNIPYRMIQIDMLHIIRTEPLDSSSPTKKNGKKRGSA